MDRQKNMQLVRQIDTEEESVVIGNAGSKLKYFVLQ